MDSVSTSEEANKLEIFYIAKYDSFNNGYNMTVGGESCDRHLNNSEEVKEKIRVLNKIKSTGSNNGRYCGFTDEEIIDFAVKYFIDNDYILHRNGWSRWSYALHLPQNYSKFRFNGNGHNGFIEKLKEKLSILNIPYNEESFSLPKEVRYPSKYSNLYGQKFGDYKVISDNFIFQKCGYSYVLCKCDCGGLKTWEACRFIKRSPKCNCKKEDKVENRKLKSINTTVSNKGRYCGLTDDEIIEIALKFFIMNGYILTINQWKDYSKSNGLPQSYSKFRFSGNKYKGFIDKLKIRLLQENILFTDDSFTSNKYNRYKSVKYGNLENKIFGDYTIKSESFSLGLSTGNVLCKCVCGQLKTFRASSLMNKKYKCICEKDKNAKDN